MIVLDRLTLAPGLVLLVADEGDGVPRPVPWLVEADRRATSGDGAATALVALLGGGSRSLGPFRVTTWQHAAVGGERSVGVDQTNQSVVVGERAVVKWFRTAEPGPHPAPAMLDALQRHRFSGMPAPWGLLEWSGPGDRAPRLLAAVDTLLAGALDGWTWTVGDLRAAVLDGADDEVRETGRRLGDLVGRMHAALAEDGVAAATADDLAAWDAGADRDLAQALAATTGDRHALLARRSAALHEETRSPAHAIGSPLIRVHGDLHVGQVLRRGTGADATYVVTDFDGNPVVPPEERSLPQPPALDVAGLAQSIQHAALVLRHHEPHHDPAAVSAAADACEDAFLTTYAVTVATLGHPRLVQPGLVRGFRLRQVCREFSYAAEHLPRWFYVPEAALPALLPLGDPA